MATELSKDILDALQSAGNGQLEAVDPETGRVYFVVDGETHYRAMDALRRIDDQDAIARGIADMEAGRGRPVAEADAILREKLGFPQRADA